MRPILALLLLWPLGLPGQSSPSGKALPKLIGVVEVGWVLQDCVHVGKAGHAAEVPIGFMVSPEDAFRAAREKLKLKCPNPYGNLVFADNDAYYITVGPVDTHLQSARNGLTAAMLKGFSIRVHGLTGAVSPPDANR